VAIWSHRELLAAHSSSKRGETRVSIGATLAREPAFYPEAARRSRRSVIPCAGVVTKLTRSARPQALEETLAETVPVRAARYQACYEVMLAGMERLGFQALLPRPLHSGLLTAFHTPARPGFTFDRLHDFLYARGITLYPGKLPGTDTFRVANIGALTPTDLATFVAAVEEFLNDR
jgi:hypothetical protein